MSGARLEPERIARLQGFGLACAADAYVVRPTTVDEVRGVLDLACQTGRKVVLRGAGCSYGDASIAPEALALDCSAMNRILAWDPATGVIDAEAGVSIESLWRTALPDGWWPPVVSGTMMPTLAGALAMNIHGKNNSKAGTLGQHVLDLEVLDGAGRSHRLTPDDEAFRAVISGAGLLGVITRVKLQMHRVTSGNLQVTPVSVGNLDAQLATFDEFEGVDYRVSWVDCFARGARLGRGLFHAASHESQPNAASLRPESQDLPSKVLGVLPKSQVWRALRALNRPLWMSRVNWAKYAASRLHGDRRPFTQGLVAFSFLLDYVPDWRRAYLPGGFIQYQSFVPLAEARRVFRAQIEMQQKAGLVSFLGVIKRHRPDDFLFTHAVDGYSLALDFKVTPQAWPRLRELCWRMNDLVIEAGGRFYFAKDSTLRPQDVCAYLGEATLKRFRDFRAELDPHGLFTSALAERVGLL
ncbi:MAG: FAD-binding oxidoreductase, partial [Fimbriimonas ginsengisoli]|nr:FAD-binding oxidoreductase [Fimbriimonas ginsengisoli]